MLKRYLATGAVHGRGDPPSEDGAAVEGHITFVDNAVDPTTGTIK